MDRHLPPEPLVWRLLQDAHAVNSLFAVFEAWIGTPDPNDHSSASVVVMMTMTPSGRHAGIFRQQCHQSLIERRLHRGLRSRPAVMDRTKLSERGPREIVPVEDQLTRLKR